MEDVPNPIIIKVKRKYTKKTNISPTKKIPIFPIQSASKEVTPPMSMLPLQSTIKIKRKYTRKQIHTAKDSIPSRPLQYTSNASFPIVPMEPTIIEPKQSIKIKRKYIRKKPLQIGDPIVLQKLIDELIGKPEELPQTQPQPVLGEPQKEAILGEQLIKKEVMGEPPKIKRKYTRKIPLSESKAKTVKVLTPLLQKSPFEKDIKLSPLSPIIMIQEAKRSPEDRRRLNEIYIALMKDLAFVMRHQKDFMRARAYDNARETIENFSGDITDPEQLRNKPGIGKTIHQKLVDFLETGTLKVLENNKTLIEKKRAIDVFLDIYGIGEKKAEELVDQGITTLEQLREQQNKVLNDKQRIGLKYYHDILQRIPRSEIEDYENLFKKATPPTLQIQIVGSYRRGLQSSGDIDAILTSKDPNDFVLFVNRLLENQIIVEVLSRGSSKCLVIAKLPWAQYARRIDFLYTTPQEFPFSILYFTGSKGFNTTMREHALKLNMTLNEHGLSVMEARKKGALVAHEFPTERSIFDFLNLEYKDPKDRVDGSAVVLKGTQQMPMIQQPTLSQIQTIESKAIREPSLKKESQKPTKILKSKTIKPRKTKMVDTKQNIENFKSQGIKVLESLIENDLVDMVKEANRAFHTEGKPLMTDAEYDILRDFIEEKFPKNVAVKEVGAEITKNKANLPYEMASMDKIKPDTGALSKWTAKYTGPYVISCKLDGVSGLYTTENPSSPKLYTRGDGKVGQDVSYLIPHLRLPKEEGVVIRGEFIIKRRVFEEKYKSKFSNSRNLVAGIVNAKSLDDKIRDVDFVAYEVIKPENLTPSNQMEFLKSLDIDVVKHQSQKVLTNEGLSEVLQKWRDASVPENLYEIDGIIVSDDKVYPRTSGNPEHSFAFKMVLSDQIAETHVLDVEWNVSKDGYLKPRVRVSEVELGGVKINYVTGINGAFIEKNKIGVGAIVKIVRSGDVIPKIEAVVTPAENPKMPDVHYKWNTTHIDLILEGEDIATNITVREKQITQFFKAIGVDGLGPGNVAKIVKAGYDSICKVLEMDVDDFMKVEGFQRKTSDKLATGIVTKVGEASLATIMSASNQFGRGFGIERIELILNSYPNVLQERDLIKLKSVKGIAEKTAKEFLENIPRFLEFLRECNLEYKMTEESREAAPAADQSHPLFGKSIVMTGFRDKDLESKLKSLGAKMSSSVSKNTFVVLVKSMDEDTGKAEDAKKLGITIMTPDMFREKFSI